MIENFGDVTALSILVGLMVWYFKHQTRRQAEREDKQDAARVKKEEKHDKEQKEERNYYRNVISGELNKNVDLNVKGLALQKEMINDLNKHDDHSEKFSEKVVETLGLICDKMNGGSKRMTKAKKKLSEKT